MSESNFRDDMGRAFLRGRRNAPWGNPGDPGDGAATARGETPPRRAVAWRRVASELGWTLYGFGMGLMFCLGFAVGVALMLGRAQ